MTPEQERIFREGIVREARAVAGARQAGRADVLRVLTYDPQTRVYTVTEAELAMRDLLP